jgi:hypothetical protein
MIADSGASIAVTAQGAQVRDEVLPINHRDTHTIVTARAHAWAAFLLDLAKRGLYYGLFGVETERS